MKSFAEFVLLIIFFSVFAISYAKKANEKETVNYTEEVQKSDTDITSPKDDDSVTAYPYKFYNENDTSVLALSSLYFDWFEPRTVQLYEVNTSTRAGLNIFDFIINASIQHEIIRSVWTAIVSKGGSKSGTWLFLLNQGSAFSYKTFDRSFGIAIIRVGSTPIPIIVSSQIDTNDVAFECYFKKTDKVIKLLYDYQDTDGKIKFVNSNTSQLVFIFYPSNETTDIVEIYFDGRSILCNREIGFGYRYLDEPVKDFVNKFLEDNSYPSSGTTPE